MRNSSAMLAPRLALSLVGAITLTAVSPACCPSRTELALRLARRLALVPFRSRLLAERMSGSQRQTLSALVDGDYRDYLLGPTQRKLRRVLQPDPLGVGLDALHKHGRVDREPEQGRGEPALRLVVRHGATIAVSAAAARPIAHASARSSRNSIGWTRRGNSPTSPGAIRTASTPSVPRLASSRIRAI